MAYLGQYIRQMLSAREPVILPGFGSLVIAEGSGKKGPDGKIDPPGAIILFDATHPKGDGKLAEEYAAGEGLDPEEARQQVLELVDAIKFRLDKGENYQLDLVGTFSRDDDNKVHFTKDPNWVIDPEVFGLSPIDLLELEGDEKTDEEEEDSADILKQEDEAEGEVQPTESMFQEGSGESGEESALDTKEQSSPETTDMTGTDEHEESVTESPESQEDELTESFTKSKPDRDTTSFAVTQQSDVIEKPARKRRGRLIFWIVASVLVATLAIILLIPSDNGIKIGKEGIVIKESGSEAGNTESPVEDQQAAGQELNTQTDENQEEQGIEDAGANEEEAPVPQTVNKYFIIAGSFQNLANASELMESLKAGGYSSEIIITENRMYRVTVRSFETKDAALRGLEEIRSNPGLERAWVLTR